jgi:hypothetical protein
LVAEALGDVSDDAVWRVMRKHDLHLDRRQSWCVSTDPEFSRKASEIVRLYLKPPENVDTRALQASNSDTQTVQLNCRLSRILCQLQLRTVRRIR